MAERRTPSYPGVGEPDRLDAIVRRGRSLRRRRQMVAAGAGGGGALAVVAAVLLLSGGGGEPIATDTADGDPGTSTTTTQAPAPDDLVVRVLDGAPARIQVDDPEQPDAEGTQQCVYVRLRPASSTERTDPAVAEGFGCAPGLSANGAVDLALALTTGPADPGAVITPEPGTEPGVDLGDPQVGGASDGPVEIFCAVSVYNPPPEGVNGVDTRRGSTTFTVSVPDLAPGEYQADVIGTSGLGDGCPPAEEELERERSIELTATISLP